MLFLQAASAGMVPAPKAQFLTVKEAAAFLRINPNTLYRQLKHSRVPGAFRIGADWRIDMKVYLAAMRKK